jgi:signal transduction histidine kinase
VDWVLRCDDEGPGVFEADLQRIFEPFYRSSSAQGTPAGDETPVA